MVLADPISPRVTLHGLLTAWQTGYLNLVGMGLEAIAIGAYIWGVRRLEARGRRWSAKRTVSFVSGVVLVVVAVQSGLASYDDRVFVVHVVQHMLLMNFAAILLALGAPVTLALQASGRRIQRVILKVIHHRIVEFATHPALVAVLAYGTMIFYFATPFYQFSLEHRAVHDLAHLHFLISGYLFWWIVIGRDPSRWRLGYPAKIAILAAGIPVNAILGIDLTSVHGSVASHFHTLADTHAGGSVLWVVGELVTVVALGVAAYQWMQYEEREAIRVDRKLDSEDPSRARAGSGQ